MAEGGLLDTLTAENGPLLKLADVADTLNRLAPGLEALAPTIDALHDAVVTLSQVVNPLSNIADRIPIPGRRPRRSSTQCVAAGHRRRRTDPIDLSGSKASLAQW